MWNSLDGAAMSLQMKQTASIWIWGTSPTNIFASSHSALLLMFNDKTFSLELLILLRPFVQITDLSNDALTELYYMVIKTFLMT